MLVSYIGFPALIATLATYYACKSLAIVINDQSPISTPPIQDLYSLSRAVELPLFGRDTRFKAYVYAGLISGLVAVVTVSQFASARPDAGVTGNGMALPAITIAVLRGVAITGGIGRVSGVVLTRS